MCGSNEECNHKFIYGGVKYKDGDMIAGSSAKIRHYYDWFYCERCLEIRYEKLDCGKNSSYDHVRFGATPINEEGQ